jgi:hypothetical protein
MSAAEDKKRIRELKKLVLNMAERIWIMSTALTRVAEKKEKRSK